MAKVGLTVQEGVANGATPFRTLSKRNIGLLMERERGIPNKAVLITSLEEDYRKFGARVLDTYGSYVVKTIFTEAQQAPVKIYGVRIVGDTSVTASGSGTIGAIAVNCSAAYKGEADPGTWGNNLQVIVYSFDYKAKGNFLAEVYYKGILVESFTAVTMAALQLAIEKGSEYVKVTFSGELATGTTVDLIGTLDTSLSSSAVVGTGTAFTTELAVGSVIYSGTTYLGTVLSITDDTHLTLTGKAQVALEEGAAKKRQDLSVTVDLENGTYVSPVEADFYANSDPANPLGMAAFNGVDVQIIASTENHTLSLAVKGKEYASSRGDCVFMANLPLNADEGTLELFARTLQDANSSFIYGLHLWTKILDDSGNYLIIPGLGAAIGAGFIRTPYLNNDEIHIPPAGVDGTFVSILEIYPRTLSQATIDRYVQDFTVNVAVYKEGVGTFLISSRTYSTNSLYHSVHIRMQTSYYKRMLDANMLFMVQKPKTPELVNEGKVALHNFFIKEYDKGALERSVSFAEACQIISDQTNNPNTQDRKILNFDILWIPTECTESVKLSLQRNDGYLLTKID